MIYRDKFGTCDEAKRKIFEYVEMYYNHTRAYSTLGFLSFFEYEK
ncbi:MAG: IS3 family transposase [Candidatus Omnitrophica bacterium]|nr:IS3 family transposase [Candidatus Omnitrophota bacterium]